MANNPVMSSSKLFKSDVLDSLWLQEKRAAYDRYVAETNQVEQAWSELSDLISQLHEKMEYAANTIR